MGASDRYDTPYSYFAPYSFTSENISGSAEPLPIPTTANRLALPYLLSGLPLAVWYPSGTIKLAGRQQPSELRSYARVAKSPKTGTKFEKHRKLYLYSCRAIVIEDKLF